MISVKNPIISGFYPDPSICRVEGDYYLVNSSFAYFPGIPIFHSRDLANWKQIGNAINRVEQVDLKECSVSEGIFAPTIRYHNGLFYIITTNVPNGGNFIITATDPAGPWSNACYLGEEAPGIDPSLFFDDDGKAYYVGTRPNQDGERYFGDWEIWIREIDIEKMVLTGTSTVIWKGAMQNAIWPEGPHLYKKDSYYYLLTAEGGTEENHCIMVARAKEILGEYEGYPKNPLFTHRHLGQEYPIQSVGHGDFVESAKGDWYLVMLGMRPVCGVTSLGRETFLAKVTWENNWPVVNRGSGKLEDTVSLPEPDCTIHKALKRESENKKVRKEFEIQGFTQGRLNHSLVTLGGANLDDLFESRNGWLRVKASCKDFKQGKPISILGVRQKDYQFSIRTKMEFDSKDDSAKAGLVLFQNETSHLTIYKRHHEDGYLLCIEATQGKKVEVIARTMICEGAIELKMDALNQKAEVLFRYDEDETFHVLARQIDLCPYSTEFAGGFVGCVLGIFVIGDSEKITANFKHLIYEANAEID